MRISNLFSPDMRVNTAFVFAAMTYVVLSSVRRVRQSKRLLTTPLLVRKDR